MTTEKIFGFIGTGNMGAALARAASRQISGSQIWLSNRTPEKARRLAEELGAQYRENEEIARSCDYIFLGVKPQMMGQLLESLRSELAGREKGFVLVSMAAGLSIEAIQRMAGGDYPVLRIMPNTPASVGCGMIIYAASPEVDAAARVTFLEAMSGAGRFDALAEGLMDAGSAVSGCGPAFADLFLEALADGGVACGLPRDKAMLYAAQTLLGSARLLLETEKHPGELKDAVCSPGGSTIMGVRALEQAGFRSAVLEAVLAAWTRTGQLGK